MQKYLENDEFVDKVYEAVKTIGDDAIPLIEEHLNIHFKDGKCCCPFHQENTPSFVWNPKTKTCRCFGCGKHYNIVNVLVDKTGSHKEALNELFRMAHMEVNTYGYKPFDGGRTDWFADYKYPHPEHEPTEEHSIKYLNMRGISKQTIDYAEVKEDSHGNIAFEYRDLDNKLLCVKYRASHKLHKGEAKMWFQKDASTVPILYNVKKLDYLEPLVINEGEIDTLSVIESGYTNACSVPNGAGSLNWVEFNYDYLQNFQTLILWFDNDPAGQEGLNKIIPRLGEYRCKIVKPTSEDEQMVEDYYAQFGREGIRKTDANNILLACGKQRIIELINRAEEIPAKNLKYLMDCEISDVKDMEKVSTGLKGMDDMLFGNLMSCFTIYTGKPGCVDCDTEYFNGTEWKRIADYTEGEKVLQYNADGTAKLVIPEQYHKYEAETLWHFKTRYGLDQCLSDEHNVYYITSKNNIYHKTFKEIRENHERAVCGFKGKFITSFEYSGNGIDLTDEQIELMCAVICDGNFPCDSAGYDTSHRPLYDQCCVTVKKERKKKRMRDILNRCHIEWKETLLQREGYSTFTFFAPRHEKVFTKYWYNCNQHQLQVICNNVLFWDGCLSHGQKTFSTSIKESADFIQFAFTSCGYKAHICTYDTKGQIREINRKQYVRKSMTYIVSITNKNTPTMSTPKKNEKVRIDPYQTKDGFKYCFTVPSHMWVMRRNNCICITGNSGKSSLCNLTSIISPIEQGHKVFVFSGELAEGQLLDWIMSPLAGLNHLRVWDSNSSARKAFTVTNEAEIAIRKYYHDNIILYSAENELATSEDALLEAMETAFRKYGCDTFVIDNMMTVDFTSNGVDNKYEQQKKFITRLMNFTNSHTVNVNCIIHPKKVAAGEDLDIYSLHGCSEYSNLCHRLIAVKRLTDDEEGYSIECQIIKDRPTQAAGKSCKLMYDTATRRIYSTNEELSQKFSWEKSSNINYPDAIKKNLLCNRKDVLATIPKIVSYSAECDQY